MPAAGPGGGIAGRLRRDDPDCFQAAAGGAHLFGGRRALAETDMVLVSGGSSVGTRDLTVEVLAALDQSRILVHGVSISPGKPTILAQCGAKPFWGLPGHVTSAMVVFMVMVRPFLAHLAGWTT